MIAKVLKGLVPAPLRPPVRKAVLFVVPPLRRQLKRTWRRRLKRRLREQFRVWRKQLKILKLDDPKDICLHVWIYLGLSIGRMRRGNRAVEADNHIHLINPLRSYTGAPLRTLQLFEELRKHADVHLWVPSKQKVPLEIIQRYPVKHIAPWRLEFPLLVPLLLFLRNPSGCGSVTPVRDGSSSFTTVGL